MRWRARRAVFGATMAALCALSPAQAHGQSQAVDPRHAVCELAVADAAARHGVPYEVLRALAFVESGRTRNGSRGPWPWTINLEGEGRYFETRAEAEAFAAAALVEGRRSWDAGCMQINYRWHGDAFSEYAEMFDPAANADYAARFLSDLHRETGDWLTAAGYYHSRTPEHTQRYRGLVQRMLARLTAPPARGVLLAAVDGAPTPPTIEPAQVDIRVAGLAPEHASPPVRRPDRRDPSVAPGAGPFRALAAAPDPAPSAPAGPAIVFAALPSPSGERRSPSLFGDASGGWRGLLRESTAPLVGAPVEPADATGLDVASVPAVEDLAVEDPSLDPDGAVVLSPRALAALDALDGRIDADDPIEDAAQGGDQAAYRDDPASAPALSAGAIGLGALPRGRPLF